MNENEQNERLAEPGMTEAEHEQQEPLVPTEEPASEPSHPGADEEEADDGADEEVDR